MTCQLRKLRNWLDGQFIMQHFVMEPVVELLAVFYPSPLLTSFPAFTHIYKGLLTSSHMFFIMITLTRYITCTPRARLD